MNEAIKGLTQFIFNHEGKAYHAISGDVTAEAHKKQTLYGWAGDACVRRFGNKCQASFYAVSVDGVARVSVAVNSLLNNKRVLEYVFDGTCGNDNAALYPLLLPPVSSYRPARIFAIAVSAALAVFLLLYFTFGA